MDKSQILPSVAGAKGFDYEDIFPGVKRCFLG